MKKNLKILMFFFTFIFASQTTLLFSDLVEHKSTKKACPLCNCGEVLCKNHKKLYGRITDETNILFSSENFYAVIDNYPVCDGHILIIPKEHKLSCSCIDESLQQEFQAIIETLSYVFGTKEYGLFEHGSNMVGLEQKPCGNSVYHAHMHFIPGIKIGEKEIINCCSAEKKEYAVTLEDGYEFQNFCVTKGVEDTILGFMKTLPTKSPYLFFYSNSESLAFCVPDDAIKGGVTSQFFRRIFAEYFQKDQKNLFWNWKNPEELQQSIKFRETIIKKTVDRFKDKEKIASIFKKKIKLLQKS